MFGNGVDRYKDALGNGSSLRITFNRPVEIVPFTLDCQGYNILTSDLNGSGGFPVRSSTPSLMR